MADFRKWVLVLAVLAIFVVPATAQVTCIVASSNIPIRAEGLAEPVSEIDLNCASSSATFPGGTAAFTAFFTTNVTSVLRSATSTTTDTILTASDGTVIQGSLNGSNSLVFNNVPIPAGATPFTVRINNVRVNASAIGAGGSVSVIMSATSSPANSVVFAGTPTATVATVQTGLIVTRDAAVSFAQCAPATKTVSVTFKEGFASAFKNFQQESGLPTGTTPPGSATQGTRLFVRVSNIPSNATITVPGAIGTTGSETAFLVGFNPTTGGSGTGNVTGVGTGLVTGANTVTLTSGTGTAVYEITGTGLTLASVESIVIPVSITTTAGVAVTPTTGGPTVSGGFAPISTVGTAAPATGTGSAPVPRFVDVATQNFSLFSVTPCVTNLLFPFLTNQAGFDTGVALINTSLDNATGTSNLPFNTTTQSGTCTVFYFGAVAGGGAVPAPQTTPTIAAGQMFAFALSAGGVAGSTSSTVGFQGYAIARCNFQFAHGYAFVSDLGASKLAHGYLAPIIPDRGAAGRVAEPFTTAPTTSGEQLIF